MVRRTRQLLIATVATCLMLAACTGPSSFGALSAAQRAHLTAGEAAIVTAAWHHDEIALLATSTGGVARSLAASRSGGLQVTGMAVLGAQRLLVAWSEGPSCNGHTAGCGAKPHSCGAQVDEVSLASGAVRTLWRLGADATLTGVWPSPDGREVAMLTSGCVPPFTDSHLLIRRLTGNASWTIGAGLGPCHTIRGAGWMADSRRLVVSYTPSTNPEPFTAADGVCPGRTDSAALVAVDAQHPQPGLTGQQHNPPAGCSYQSVTASPRALYAVQACGSDDARIDGSATLVRLDQQLQPQRSWAVGECTDGNDIAANSHDQVLISAYLYCGGGQPQGVLDELDRGQLRHITAIPGGLQAFQHLAW